MASTTINAFFSRGTPTFITGTAGDERADAGLDAQIAVIRSVLFPTAGLVPDSEIDPAGGPDGWPSNPVVYGGPHVNSLMAGLTLPFQLSAGRLVLGDDTFEGDNYFLITVIPASPKDDHGPGHPELLLFAGTGDPGIAGINAAVPGAWPIVVKDEFGVLASGQWTRSDTGALRPTLSKERGRRLPWRSDDRTLAGTDGSSTAIASIRFLKDFPVKNEAELAGACMKGLEMVVRKLGIEKPASVTVHVYPDLGSKKSLTDNGGTGHAVVAMRTLHMSNFAARPLARLMAHEGTHVLGYEWFGPERTAFLAEGLAVWVADGYQDKTVAEWREALRGHKPPALKELLGPMFRTRPEPEVYPLAGIFVDVAVRTVGIGKFGRHLLGASGPTWDAACEAAGTTSALLQERFATAFEDGDGL